LPGVVAIAQAWAAGDSRLTAVVIGGLVSATLRTLFVLPVLYTMFFGERAGLKAPAQLKTA
jgi:Cu/Ag efflux pump CusA